MFRPCWRWAISSRGCTSGLSLRLGEEIALLFSWTLAIGVDITDGDHMSELRVPLHDSVGYRLERFAELLLIIARGDRFGREVIVRVKIKLLDDVSRSVGRLGEVLNSSAEYR